MICEVCGQELQVGDWPFCQGARNSHGPIRELNARRFESIVVWQSNSDPEKFSYPGDVHEAPPEGYHAIEITNLPQADRFVHEVNRIERVKSEQSRQMRYTLDDAGVKDRRAEEDARGWVMRGDGTKFYVRGNARAEALQKAVREWADKRREQKRSRHSSEPNFHINILSFDSGNRNSYSGPETNWRERKK